MPLTIIPHSLWLLSLLHLPRRIIRSGRTMVLWTNRSLGDRTGFLGTQAFGVKRWWLSWVTLDWEKITHSLLLLDFFLSRWEMSSNHKASLCFPEKNMKFVKKLSCFCKHDKSPAEVTTALNYWNVSHPSFWISGAHRRIIPTRDCRPQGRGSHKKRCVLCPW